MIWQPVLQGDRLLLRPLLESDRGALYAAASDPALWAMHPDPDRWREEEFAGYFDSLLERGGALAVVDRQGGAIIGSSGFANHDPALSQVEIGWTFLARSHWGQGCNRELKRLMLAHAFQYVAAAVFSVGAGNLRSRRAMMKIGGRETGAVQKRMRSGVLTDHIIYSITREDFASGPLMQPQVPSS